jgi:diguanylate cyclase (GGDEF)-like protein
MGTLFAIARLPLDLFMLVGSYNPALVVCSLLVAMLASYTALDMAARIVAAPRRAARWWLAGGASAMGFGIWSMHFVGMLAFSLPIPLGYDPALTLLSLALAVACSTFALWLVVQQQLPWYRLCAGALLMGAGVSVMHYTGMAAMRMTPAIRYAPGLFAASVAIAVAASGAALWTAFRLRRHTSKVHLLRACAAMVMGCAVVGMHYTGMAAAQFAGGSVCGVARAGASNNWLALLIIVITLAVLTITLLSSVLDARLESRTAVLADSLATANLELTHLLMHDSLTQLPNRILLQDRLEQALRAAPREGPCAVLFMDVDRLKEINEAFGHKVGDRVLAVLAQRMRAALPAQATLARIGGDEFVLLAPIAEPADAVALAERAMASIAEPIVVAALELRVSVSIGIALYPDDGGDPDVLLAHAATAMDHAKHLGRNGYCFFEASMNADMQQQQQLLQDLRAALERGQLILFYQPQWRAPAGPVVGVEALLRWQHPTRGLLGPDQFIPLAEKTGLIVQIGTWVLDEGCRQMRAWREAGHPGWSLAVNLSALQVAHSNLIETVRATLARHGLEPRTLMLEITETTAMCDVESTLATLHQLHAMGVKVSIDDFGTGYSSLLYLKRLLASELKIDRGFVRDLPHDTEDAAIVAAIVALGHTLKLKIVAEGVETEAQRNFLTALGCDTLQGFLLGRPMPAQRLMQWLYPEPVAPQPVTL